jgi:hypothetical protein
MLRGSPIRKRLLAVSIAALAAMAALPASAAPPLNDNFADALTISSNQDFYSAALGEATAEPGEPIPSGPKTAWWRLTAAASGRVGIASSGFQFGVGAPHTVRVYTGSSLGALTQVAASLGAFRTGVVFDTVAGLTYRIQVSTAAADNRVTFHIGRFGPTGGFLVDARPNALLNVDSSAQTLANSDVLNATTASKTITFATTLPGLTLDPPSVSADVADLASTVLSYSPAGVSPGIYIGNVTGTSPGVSGSGRYIIRRLEADPGLYTDIVAALLPTGRSVTFGTPATVFGTIVNAGARTAISCMPRLTDFAATVGALREIRYDFQETDPATNLVVGTPNTPFDIAPGASKTFVLALGASQPIAATELIVEFMCANAGPPSAIPGVNTMLFQSSPIPVADAITIGSTLLNDGIVTVPLGGASVFAIATVNIGASAPLTAEATATPFGRPDPGLSLDLTICETTGQPGGACIAPPTTAAIVFTGTTNAVRTFTVFVQSTGAAIPFDPGQNRIFVYMKQGATVVGGTGAAVRTQ